MAFQSFGVKSKTKKPTGSLKAAPIAEFADPTYDHLEDPLQAASPEDRERQSSSLQVYIPSCQMVWVMGLIVKSLLSLLVWCVID